MRNSTGIAEMMSQLGDEFRGPLSNLSKTAGSRLQLTADQMREHDAAQLARSLARFAKDRPLLFIGGAFVLGLGVGRLLSTGDEE